MPSSIIEEPRARSAKTVRPPQRPAGSSSVPSTGKAWKGRPAATVPRRGIVTADPTSTATASHPALVAARMIPLLASVRFEAGPRVGRYRVRITALDPVAVPALAARPGVRLVVVDEIGKMESLSPRFAAAVRAALDSPVPVLGTIGRSGGALIAEVRRRPDVTLVDVTLENRDALPAKIAGLLGL